MTHILSYDEFVKKTKAELSTDLDVASSNSTKPQIKTLYSTATEKPKIKPPSLQRWSGRSDSEDQRPDGKITLKYKNLPWQSEH
ncbi:centrosome-associated protein 350-like [Chiloscyllium plagiosum]|uniref:centrosome-associated protein 350-like n=1 Tax=Chiloscyllium plagiosum TaxID=36176 RepID=UPI001CB873D5|nr:centrosome-associated protein 350-like [Chiloscyllium plagiosum]